ncbi:hypothetical protein DRP53_05025 [candidate division WOR-3 bacterium]|uniref:Tetratricopeptide repeat protein n=1 Tax=candidate division WOR-3 bacterium TaxID=2052148 RepID=A0A660SK23_UNCW3|nr:MAG: hypothetical protein DRP53_05025 [candidate division WOR-3 bacterium]
MSGIRHCWLLILITCLHLGHRDPFYEGIILYQKGNLKAAEENFLTAIAQGDSVEKARRYLIRIYRLRGDERKAANQYILMIRSGFIKPDIINYLAHYYEDQGKYHNYYLIIKLGVNHISTFGKQIVTRRELAKLLTGLLTRRKIDNPIGWTMKYELLGPMPDGNFYPDDTLSVENLAMVLSPHLPQIATSEVKYPWESAIVQLQSLGLTQITHNPKRPLDLKTAITVLEKAKSYLIRSILP